MGDRIEEKALKGGTWRGLCISVNGCDCDYMLVRWLIEYYIWPLFFNSTLTKMVDLHTKNSGDRREGKVKILLDRTPSFIRSKFWSVLGSSNDLINGITNKVRINIFYISIVFSSLFFGVYFVWNSWWYILVYICSTVVRCGFRLNTFCVCLHSWTSRLAWTPQQKPNLLKETLTKIVKPTIVSWIYSFVIPFWLSSNFPIGGLLNEN